MNHAKTAAERQREFRRVLADTGRTEVRGIFAHPEDHAAIKEHAAKLQRKRAKAASKAPQGDQQTVTDSRSAPVVSKTNHR